MPGKKTNPNRVPSNAILLSKVASLTLRSGRNTASRRVDPAPQLQCIGPKEVCQLYQVDTMRCTNEGADYDAENIQWSCKASLPEEFKVGSTDVICEGYESSDDPYVLRGSCGVEYRLLLTDKGDQRYGRLYHEQREKPSIHTQTTLSGLFFLVFIAVLVKIVYSIWTKWNQTPRRPGSGRNNGGGGNDDPPPPYDDPPPYYNQPRKPKTQSKTSKSSTSTRASSSRTARQEEQQAWRPGFWTGTAAGAAAGYYAGRRGQTQTRQSEPVRQPETQQRTSPSWNIFGTPQQHAQPQPPDSSGPSNTASSSFSARYDSTGFGETRRR